MATRPVSGTITTPIGEPWPDFPIDVTVQPGTYTVAAHFPPETVEVMTAADGTFSVDLEQGLTYRVGLRGAYQLVGSSTRYPAGSQFDIVVPPGEGPISLEAIRANPVAPDDPDLLDFVANHLGDMSNPHQTTAAQVGLDQVDNTSDADKPVSTAQQDALVLKANASDLDTHTSRSDNPHGVTAHQAGAYTQAETDDALGALESATDTALAGKSNVGHQHTSADVTDFASAVVAQADVAANTAARHTHANTSTLDSITAQMLIPTDGHWYQLLSRDPVTLAPVWIDPVGYAVPTLLLGFNGELSGLDRDGVV